jgi:phosphoribosyl-AMP cyclohydrolase
MKIDFKKMNGLIPAIVQDWKNKDVLMLGFMNNEAWKKTIKTKKVTFFSRTRKKLWTKGETSGNFLLVKKIYMDCDNDSVLIKAKPKGNTCHTGKKSCFFKEIK